MLYLIRKFTIVTRQTVSGERVFILLLLLACEIDISHVKSHLFVLSTNLLLHDNQIILNTCIIDQFTCPRIGILDHALDIANESLRINQWNGRLEGLKGCRQDTGDTLDKTRDIFDGIQGIVILDSRLLKEVDVNQAWVKILMIDYLVDLTD